MTRPHREGQTGLRAACRPLLDDRGRPARGIRRADILRAAESEHIGLRGLAVRLRHAMKSESRRVTPDRIALTVLAVFVVIFTTGIVNGLILPLLRVPVPGAGLLVFIALVILANWLIARYVRRGARHQLARTAVAEGVCGACAFPLRDATVDPGRCAICPECGAAWRTDRIVEPFWATPPVDRLGRSLRCSLTPGVLAPWALYAPDDRGRFVQTPDARLMRLRPETRATLPMAEIRRLRRAMRRVGIIPRTLLLLALLPIPALLVWATHSMIADGETIAVWFVGTLALLTIVPLVLIPFSAAFSTPHRTSRVLVRRGRCGCCLRSIHDAPRDAHGRAVCPECGSAWLPPPSTRPG